QQSELRVVVQPEFIHHAHHHIGRGVDVVIHDQYRVVQCGPQAGIDGGGASAMPLMPDNASDFRTERHRFFGTVIDDKDVRYVVVESKNALVHNAVSVVGRDDDGQLHGLVP